MDAFGWFNIIVGVVGLGLAFFGLIYSVRAANEATKAAQRASELLTRLVVLPYRQLDGNYAKLTPKETAVLLKMFEVGKVRHSPLTLDQLRKLMPADMKIPQGSLEQLVDYGWLTKMPGGFRVNSERIPYLTFLEQTENGEFN